MKKKQIPSAKTLLRRVVGGKISQMASFSDLFENTTDAIFLLDRGNLEVLDRNPVAAELLLHNPALLGNQKVLDALATLKRRPRLAAPVNATFPASAGRSLTLEINATRLKLADYCEVIQMIARDVTEITAARQELLCANIRLAQLSHSDEMTGLFNFRYIKEALKKEHDRSTRYRKPYSVILCDVDHFKNFNDKNGHPEGDRALKTVASLLQKRARKADVVARYGGEEFLVLCPEVDAAQALILAESLREIVEGEKFPFGEKQPLGKVTISLGVASFPEMGASAEEIVRAADDALYQSKAEGRNRVSVYAPGKTAKKARAA